MAFCENCGFELNENNKFCPRCGTPAAPVVNDTFEQMTAAVDAPLDPPMPDFDSISSEPEAAADAAQAEPETTDIPHFDNTDNSGNADNTAEQVSGAAGAAFGGGAGGGTYQGDFNRNNNYNQNGFNQNNFNQNAYGQNPYMQNQADADAQDAAKNKGMAILSYFGILVLIPIFSAKDSKFARFHAGQGLALFLVEFVWNLIFRIVLTVLNSTINNTFFPSTGLIVITRILSVISTLGGLFLFVLMIMGIANAAKGLKKELPLIGGFHLLK